MDHQTNQQLISIDQHSKAQEDQCGQERGKAECLVCWDDWWADIP